MVRRRRAAGRRGVGLRADPASLPRAVDPRREPEEGGEDPAASKAGRFWFEVVEIAAGEGWLMTTRHKAHRELYAWLEQWELDFYDQRATTELDSLIELRRYIAEFREKLLALQRSGMAQDRGLIWLTGVKHPRSAGWVDERIERALEDLRVAKVDDRLDEALAREPCA